jgi:hypothetical protein
VLLLFFGVRPNMAAKRNRINTLETLLEPEQQAHRAATGLALSFFFSWSVYCATVQNSSQAFSISFRMTNFSFRKLQVPKDLFSILPSLISAVSWNLQFNLWFEALSRECSPSLHSIFRTPYTSPDHSPTRESKEQFQGGSKHCIHTTNLSTAF